jgi:hypothetical protein
LPIRSLPLEANPATDRINQYIPYIAPHPAARARNNETGSLTPILIAALPATPKNAAAAISVRNDNTLNSQLLSGW